MKFRPLHDRVVVRRIEGEEKTKGGIIIPDTAKEKPQEGEIVAVGPGARDESGKLVPLDVKAGDRVLFGKWSGTEVKIDGQDLLIMKESDIMGVDRQVRPRSASLLISSHLISRSIEHHGCQRRKIFHRRPRQDAARRRHPRQRREGHARPQGPQRRHRQVLRRSAHHQGRRHRRQGDRARRQVREHGRPDGARSGLEDQRHRRRRHHHRDRARPGDRPGRRQGRRRRHEPDGPEARHRPRRRPRSSRTSRRAPRRSKSSDEIAQVGTISGQRRHRRSAR